MQNLGWTKICYPVLSTPDPHVSDTQARFKYIDDKVAAEAVKIADLEPITHFMERPLNFRDRTMYQLPKNSSPGPLQTKLLEIDQFCKVQKMKINEMKSKTAVFNAAISRDFYPRMVNTDGVQYENVEKYKLLGVDFVSHPKLGIKWDEYILKCVKQSYSNMWILKRLVEKGVRRGDLLMTYQSRIRTHITDVPSSMLRHLKLPLSTQILGNFFM